MKSSPISQSPKRIAIDARAISHPQPGGFKTYSENLVKNLLQRDKFFSYSVYLDRVMCDHPILTEPNGTVKVVRAPGTPIGVPFREQFSIPYQLLADHVDLVHFPCATAAIWTPCPFIITIHDTIELMPMSGNNAGTSLKRNLMHLYNRYNQLLAMRKVAAIITVSQNSKKDILDLFMIPEERIFVTYEAPDEMFVHLEDKFQQDKYSHKYELGKKYLLGIGSSDPRKNIETLIQAYSQLPSDLIQNYQLAIILTHYRLHESIFSLVEKLGLTPRVKFLKSVPNDELVFLYNGASLFVFPSLYEGFGLPPLEAMACGTPVVAANNSSIPEIVGDAALLVNDMGASSAGNELAATMAKVLNDTALQKTLSQKGIERAKSFSWQRCAQETESVYKMVLERSI